jgi:hypothetical protein
MYFLKENNGYVSLMGRVHHAARPFKVFVIIGHARDAIIIAAHESGFLNVDNDQDRVANDHGLLGHV